MMEFALPLLVITLGCYLGARFAWLAGWLSIAGMFRLCGLWAASAWLGYGTPIYVVLFCIPLGIVWAKLSPRIFAVIGLEFAFGALLILLSEVQIVPIYLVALAIFDQLLARLLVTVFNRQIETRTGVHKAIVIAGIIGCVLFVGHFYRQPILSYATAQPLIKAFTLVPAGAAPLWYHKRELNEKSSGDAQVGSVYWQSRYPETGDRCAVSFHGAAAAGSLQGSARTFGLSARQAGLRLFAVDHPGYGASPSPASQATVDTWDPAHLTSAVLEQMELQGCKTISVLGHSQGVTEALRVLTSNHSKVDRALVFGAGLFDDDKDTEDYWYSRFHIDRGIADSDRVPRENWKLIRDLYYLNQDYCSTTKAGRSFLSAYSGASKNPADAPPLHFVQFEREHANLVATRDKLWECLKYPGAMRHVLPTGHYFDSLQIGAQVFYQRASADLVAELLPNLTQSSAEDES